MPTIKEIARLAGVSRGTVDRVLNNRGAVHPDTAQKVREIAEAVRYSPNRAGKTLAVTKKKLKFGFILFSSTASNPFFLDVVRGIEDRTEALKEFGVTVEVRYAAIDDPDLQVRLIDELLQVGIDGLAIAPINHPMVIKRLKKLTQTGLPVVTANSDISDCGRIAYVGSDFRKGGATAAGIMKMATGGRANVGVIMGSPWVLCHSERVAGFADVLEHADNGIQITDTVVNHDDDLQSYVVAKELLAAHPETDALFLAAAGVAGACRAVQDAGLAGKMTIISFDTVPAVRELVRNGTILATIAQQPFYQGAKPLDILLENLGMGIPTEREFFYTSTEIFIKENLDAAEMHSGHGSAV